MTGLTKECATCDGEGAYCPACDGEGWECQAVLGQGTPNEHVCTFPCPACRGGRREPPCRACEATGRVPVTESDLEAHGQERLPL